jgi:hypothetical protein
MDGTHTSGVALRSSEFTGRPLAAHALFPSVAQSPDVIANATGSSTLILRFRYPSRTQAVVDTAL